MRLGAGVRIGLVGLLLAACLMLGWTFSPSAEADGELVQIAVRNVGHGAGSLAISEKTHRLSPG
jgi:hypothetical protein